MPGIEIAGRSGDIAEVTRIGSLDVAATTLGYAHRANLRNEEAYALVFTTTPVEEDGCTPIFYMKNLKEEEMILEMATVLTKTAEEQV